MRKFDVSSLTRELHLPVVRGIIETKELSLLRRIWRFFSFSRKFELMKDYILWCEELQMFILLPESFVYDGASVPKSLGFLYSTVGVLYVGAGPHDIGYRYEGLFLIDPSSGEVEFRKMSRLELDHVFDCLCTQETGMKIASSVARKGLFFGGYLPWKKYRKENHKPEEDFPSLYAEIRS